MMFFFFTIFYTKPLSGCFRLMLMKINYVKRTCYILVRVVGGGGGEGGGGVTNHELSLALVEFRIELQFNISFAFLTRNDV